VTARVVLDGIKARSEAVQEWRRAFHAPQNRLDYSQRDVPRLTAAVEAVLELADHWAVLAEGDRFYATRIRAAIENALRESR
jgi:hypothetical protein